MDNAKVDITDGTRRNIAYALLVILALVIVFQLVRSSELTDMCSQTIKTTKGAIAIDIMAAKCNALKEAFAAVASQNQNVFTALIGLVGSVVGFYFGSKSNQSGS